MRFDAVAASRRKDGVLLCLSLLLGLTFLIGTGASVRAQNAVPSGTPLASARMSDFKEAEDIRKILRQPPEALDLARTKLTIDRMIDPSIDVESNLKAIDAMTAGIRAMPEFGASGTSKLNALRRYVYQPGEWNDRRAFQYDLDDPFGAKISNKLLPTYLTSKKGNCITMPLLLVFLGQRLGIELTASTAPKHLLVKVRNDSGQWINLEATSGGSPARDVWLRSQMPMTDEAIANGVYLQPLTRKETAAIMATTLAEHYLQRRDYEKAIAISDVILEYYPKSVGTMTLKAVSYGRLARQRFAEKYPTPRDIPAGERDYFQYLSDNNSFWFAKAEALGWREETREEQEKYLQRMKGIQKEKAAN